MFTKLLGSKRKITEIALLMGMIVTVFAQGVCAYAENTENVTEDVFRLHILANSDSDEDQELKLKVRDAVLDESGDIFDGAINADEAKQAAVKNTDAFLAAAEKVIRENGYDYDVECYVGKSYFDERTYGTATLPEGTYDSLIITIGEGGGHNWWCVMYPALCLPAVTNTDEVMQQAVSSGILTEEEFDLINNPDNYEVRLYIVEIVKKLFAKSCK